MAMSYDTNLTNVITLYLKRLHVNVTKAGLAKQLEQNPYFPSLYCINNVLDKYKIPNEAFTLEAHHLDELEPPFIAYCNTNFAGKDFVLVTAITADSVSYISNNKKEKKITRAAFMQEWQKIVLVAEPTDQSIEPNYKDNLSKEKLRNRKNIWLWISGFSIAIFALSNFFLNTDISSLSMAGMITATKMLGCFLAVLLLIYDIDKSNSFVKNICTAGTKTDCDAVLNSKASGIAGLKWSEAGFFYFAATAFFIFYPAVTFIEKIPWLAIAAIVVSPYILFSIYYQYKVAKQWCPLCLAVQAVLLLELVWAIIAFGQNTILPSVNSAIIISILISMLLPVTAWFAVKPIIKKAIEASQYKAAYRRVLYNPEQFNQLLQQQQQAPDGWQQIGITIGNPGAKNCIVKVCNPYCGPCAKAHPELEEIIHGNEDINLKIIFTATNKEGDRAAKPVKHLLAIASKNNMLQTQQALDDWYNADKKDYEAFAAKYPLNGELKQQEEKINAMDKWCREAGIRATPTIFINGRALPENYNISELKNIL